MSETLNSSLKNANSMEKLEYGTVGSDNEKTTGNLQKEKMSLKNSIFLHTTSIVHLLLIGFTIFLIYLCFKEPFVFFTWHPLLFSIGWLLFMTEAILMISKDNIFSRRFTTLLRVRFHWIIQALALILSTAGFTIVVINKDNSNKAHFTSWHGLLGLLSMIFCIPTALNGTTALFSVKFKNYVRPAVHKFFHASVGTMAFVLGGATLVLSLYTGWFKRRTEESDIAFVSGFVIYILAIVWTLVKPALTNYQRFKHF